MREGERNMKRFEWANNPTRRGELLFGPGMILPAIVGLGLFQFLPFAVAALNSFRSFNPFTKRPNGWVGFENFANVFANRAFQSALLVTLIYIVLLLVVVIPLALALALLLDQRLPGTIVARAAILGALAASEAVSVLIWNQMYAPNSGLFNSILQSLGQPTVPFLTDGTVAIFSIVVMTAWKDVGLPMLIFLGGLQAISPSLYEAAAIDGAGPWNTFRRITLPQLRASLVLAAFIVTVGGARLFTPIILLTQGGPNGQTTNVTYFSYSQAFEFSSPGLASASVMFMLLAMLAITVAQALLIRDPKGMRR